MKLHYTKILLFFFPLNILLTSYHVYSKNKPSITSHHTQTNRSLCECDTQSSNYDKDTGMKSVMQQFVDRTSQRFEEYQERMKEKRQKRKEQRDKNIKKIIEKDKMEKSLAEKVEKGCLRCGCALGGGVLPVWGLVSGLWYATWTQYVATTVYKAATKAGIDKAIELIISKFHIDCLTLAQWKTIITAENYANEILLGDVIRRLGTTLCGENSNEIGGAFCLYTSRTNLLNTSIKTHIPTTVKQVIEEVASVKTAEIANFVPKTMTLTTTIIASVVAIVVIILVMVIIYLILRSRRRKKMTKKRQYVKLLKG